MNHKYIASYSFQKKYTQMSSYQKGFKFEVPTTYTGQSATAEFQSTQVLWILAQ